MSTYSMEPGPGLEPLGQDPSRDELITLMERATADFTDSVAGRWYQLDGTSYPGPQLDPETFLDNPPMTCASINDEPNSKGYHFQYALEGPGVDDPAAALDQARAWAHTNGWQEAESGPGSGSDESGSVFIHFTGEGLPSVTFDASTEITRYFIQTRCSTHPTVLQHYTDRAEDPKYDPTIPHDRFSDPSDFPAPTDTTG